MKIKNILIALVAFAMMMASCTTDDLGFSTPDKPAINTNSAITLTTNRIDGTVNLSVDAPKNAQADLWIDLNDDGLRAEDGSEDIVVSDGYHDYTLAPGLKTVSLYGNITYLGAASNALEAIDVSKNPYLTTLNAPLNQLTTIDVSNNQALNSLDVSDNNLTTLNVSHNSELTSLWVFNNLLSELNLSNNSNLLSIDCSGNRINQLDVTQNTQLIRLVCYNNQLTSLDIAQNSKLNRLWLFGNPISDREIQTITDFASQNSDVDLWTGGLDDK